MVGVTLSGAAGSGFGMAPPRSGRADLWVSVGLDELWEGSEVGEIPVEELFPWPPGGETQNVATGMIHKSTRNRNNLGPEGGCDPYGCPGTGVTTYLGPTHKVVCHHSRCEPCPVC